MVPLNVSKNPIQLYPEAREHSLRELYSPETRTSPQIKDTLRIFVDWGDV
jgi:hypothetical protein